MARFKWHYDADTATHFCIIAHLVTHITQDSAGMYQVKVMNVDGEVPQVLVVVPNIADFPNAIALAEETIRGSVSSQQREVFALSMLTLLAEMSWKLQESSKDKFDEYMLSVPDIGTMYVWERSWGWAWAVHCPEFTVRYASGAESSLTKAKIAASVALISLYFTHTVHTDGNTEWKKGLSQHSVPKTRPL